jgi:hypothetical protein
MSGRGLPSTTPTTAPEDAKALTPRYAGAAMDSPDLTDRVRELREQGHSVKRIARTLGLPPATVVPLVNAIIAEDYPDSAERDVLGCWVSPGWSDGLTLAEHPGWPDVDTGGSGTSGLVNVLLARRDRRSQVRVCGYLVDVYCLGVKNVIGPRLMHDGDLPEFSRSFFSAYQAPPLSVPIELARDIVYGAVGYARNLGFAPAPGFKAATAHLGPATGPSVIGFGRHGKPCFVQGPRDNPTAVLRTLERSIGHGNFDYLVTA